MSVLRPQVVRVLKAADRPLTREEIAREVFGREPTPRGLHEVIQALYAAERYGEAYVAPTWRYRGGE